MSEPIKPKNEVTLGGVAFNANHADSYGSYKVPDAKAGNYYINFKNGTKVEYSQQPTDLTFGVFGQKQTPPPSIELHDDSISFNNICGLEIKGETLPESYQHYEVNNCDSVSLNTEGSESYDRISVRDSQNVTVKGADFSNDISIRDSKNVNVETSAERFSTVFSTSVENINITTGNGDDYISVQDSNNFTIDTGNGNDKVNIVVEDDSVLDSRDVTLPQGSVKMNDGDTLTIQKETRDYSLHDLEWTATQSRSVATVKGEGVHQVTQTPDEAFETTITTETSRMTLIDESVED